MVYGPGKVNYEDWNSRLSYFEPAVDVDGIVSEISGKRGDVYAGHLRALERFTAFDAPSLAWMLEKLEIGLNLLQGICYVATFRAEGPLSRTGQILLDMFNGELLNIYQPAVALPISIGDTGFFRDNSFVRLRNVRREIHFDLQSPSEKVFTCSGDSVVGTPDGSGVIRFVRLHICILILTRT